MKVDLTVGDVATARQLKTAYDAYVLDVLREHIEEQDRAGKEKRKYKIVKELPTHEVYNDLRNKKYTTTVEDLIGSAQGEVEELLSEMESWRDGMSGTNLENSEKYSEVEEACSSLESVRCPDIPEGFPRIEVLNLPGASPAHISRAYRAGCSAGDLSQAVESLAEYIEKLPETEAEKKAELEDIQSQCEDAANELENVCFPGMF